MGNLFSYESNSTVPQFSKRGKHMTAPDFNGTPSDWPVWKTQIKASFRTFNTTSIIETPGAQERQKLKDDRVHVHGVFSKHLRKRNLSSHSKQERRKRGPIPSMVRFIRVVRWFIE